MNTDLKVAFRDVPPSPAVEATVREKVDKLAQFHDKIMSCHVVVAAPHRHQQKNIMYNVRIDLTVPGGELVVNRESGRSGAHHDVYVAIRDAFEAARRQLQDYSRRRRGAVKTHQPDTVARVSKLFAEGYGFIETDDGRELYFHENSVPDGFSRLALGSPVHFKEEQGANGPQASSVRLFNRHRS